MSEEKGIKETTEALVGLLKVTAVMAKHLKDGLQVGKDAAAIFAEFQTNEDLKTKFAAAVEGYDQIPEEIKDLDVKEGFQLVAASGPGILEIVDELRS